MSDAPTLVRFYMGYHATGEVSPDGFPIYENIIKIRKSRPPYLEVEYVATDLDIEENEEAYKLFQKEQKSLHTGTDAGYPLVMWPACQQAEQQMLAARDIYTVEDLAKLAGSKKEIPGNLRDLAQRAAALIGLQKTHGKYEEIVGQLKGQVEVLTEDLRTARTTIETLSAQVDALTIRKAV